MARTSGFLNLAAVIMCAALLPDQATLAAGILFDASKHEMGGNADWVVDADLFDLTLPAFPCTGTTNESRPQRFPSPPQAGITSGTPETFWTGGISAWAVDLAKSGHTIETLPPGGAITFGDGGNPQDLSNYQLFIVAEPQGPFTAAEKTAILAFVSAGGGLFMVADHETSDRDCDGWDSPHVWNDLTGASSAGSTGVFGIWFRVDGSATKPSEDWFDDGVDANVSTDPGDPIIAGPFGSGAGGLGLFGSTSMEIRPADNPTVTAHVWRTGQTHNGSRVTFATASYGAGRVAAVGDSSPADDSTGDTGDTLYPGWDRATGGVRNREIFLNACAWLLNPAPDTTAPAITQGPATAPSDCSATVTWSTDEPATSIVDYGADATYGASVGAQGLVREHAVQLTGLTPESAYHYRVSSSDVAGNGPTQSADAILATSAAAPPVITSPPTAGNASGSVVTIGWTTDEPATSFVEYGTTTAYGSSASAPGTAIVHSVALVGLTPSTTYHFRALSTDACGNGPAVSGDGTFTTGPASIDVSGWTLVQFNSSQTWSLPAGASIPADGYLVVARDASRAEFEAHFPSMPAGTVFFNSNGQGSCANGCLPQINGNESFELHGTTMLVDGPTISIGEDSAYQRQTPASPAGSAGSWSVVVEASANPGQGAGAPSGTGVIINEMADASDYRKEFVELYYDAGAAPPDTTRPAPITDLVASPLSSSSVRLSWTASGDDGTVGIAASYDVRSGSTRLLTNAAFSAATPLAGEPAPHIAGSAEQMVVSGLTADTPYYFALTVADEVPLVSSLSNGSAAVTAPTGSATPASHLVISQIQTNGDGGTPADDEFIEIYNPTPTAVSLSGLSLQYKSAAGTTHIPFALPAATVASHGWYLVARSAYNGSPTADTVSNTIQMAAAGGNVFLVNGTSALPSASCSTSPSIIDKVGYGTGNCPETAAASAPSANTSALRKPGGVLGSGQDTDSNAADFQGQSPSTPHSASSPPATPPSSLGNVRATLFLTGEAAGTRLDWARAAGATGYRIYRGTTAPFMAGAPPPWATTGESSYLDASIPAPIYFYVILATDGTNESDD